MNNGKIHELINPATDEEVDTILKGLEVLVKVIEKGDKYENKIH